ncbi:glucose-1-phosphate thymidylyltransferase [Nonomuraea monospora]|uniref:Glucose-1-phosphate thymidylyltransferase n=1 Tax=Nonomuraea monospora TaxID=568818 RepID=A0ABN3CT01_9ACTN
MKALVLSGGSGTRMRPLSHSMPKQLIPIANKPVLEHVLESLRELGVTEIGLVVGDRRAQIAEVVGDGSRFGARVTYIRQLRPLGLAHCVKLARGFLGDDDFVMYLGDCVLAGGIGPIAEEFRALRPAAQVVVRRVADPRAFGVVEADAAGAVLRVTEKPERPASDLVMVGVYFFTAAVHEAVERIAPGRRGELEITDAVQWLVDHRHEVRASVYDGYWTDAGRVDDVLDCNRRMLATQARGIAGHLDAISDVRGEVVIEPGARIVASTIEGPAIIGAGTLIEDSHVGPNTSIGTGCVVRATRIADSIVLHGASIEEASLRGSLIGRFTTVAPGQAHHRLVVGDHTRIELTT